MQCPSCNNSLEVDDSIDTANVSPECIIENFKCSNEDCGKHFEIEFSPINCVEIPSSDND